ncbi:scavenger receptor class B member 1-like [Portunus trituberculatus]|uniref:scavenger receptor class B member 1-like n=1 Tax=Portunus trituberculatus TaxID=210409 RepID=UPI001E1D1004|nr:scavenger receptor class B member 1-like [Portunus trituberculatus]
MEQDDEWDDEKDLDEMKLGFDEEDSVSEYEEQTTDDEREKHEKLAEEELTSSLRTEPVECCVCMSDGGVKRWRRRHPIEEQRDLIGYYDDDDYEDDFPRKKRKCSRRCCCCRWWCLLLMAIISFLALITVVFWGESTMHAGVLRGITLSEGSDKDHMWRAAEVDVLYSVYVFNLTNPDQFMQGARPRVQELGPYVYTLRETKENVRYEDDETIVEYQGRPTYFFQPHLSEGSENDPITTVNIPFVNAADMVKENKLVKTILKVVKKVHGFDTIRKQTVGELLWGSRSEVLDWARTLQDVPYPHQLFGLLMGLNYTLQPPYRMHTGKGDPGKMNKILAYNGHEVLYSWFGDTCNMIRGTDGNGFAPGLTMNDTLYIFNGQLCRSLPLVYNATIQKEKGLEAYRFVHPKGVFSYDAAHPENQCFCGEHGCPPRGILDMKSCYFGASVGFSFPHFYDGDPKLRHLVLGLRPNPEKHRTEFDIYPDLGIPLRVKLRMQMNVMLDRNQPLERARHFDVVLPVFWFEVGVDSLPGDVVGLLKLAQNLPPVVKTTSVTLCTALTLIFLLLLLAQTIATWCGWGTSKALKRPLTPEDLPHLSPCRPMSTQWQYDELHKPPRCGSSFHATPSEKSALTTPQPLTPGLDIPIIDDHTLLPPYRARRGGSPDLLPQPEDGEYSIDQVPPPYSPGPQQRTSSTVSVEIHTTASDDDLQNIPGSSTAVTPVEDLPPDHSSPTESLPAVSEENEPDSPSAPLARLEETSDSDGNSASGLPSSPDLPPESESQRLPESPAPLATSSPQGSMGNNNRRNDLPPPLESDL